MKFGIHVLLAGVLAFGRWVQQEHVTGRVGQCNTERARNERTEQPTSREKESPQRE